MQHERATQEPDGAGASELEGPGARSLGDGRPGYEHLGGDQTSAARGDQEAVILQAQNDKPQQTRNLWLHEKFQRDIGEREEDGPRKCQPERFPTSTAV